MRLHLMLVPLLLAGCAAPDPVVPDAAPSDAMPASDVVVAAHEGCTALNAFAYLDAAAVQPYVPSNWTFTTMREGMAILRMLLVECPDGSLLALSTPMFPDEASAGKHENPDVLIDVFVTDAAEAARWGATGARGEVAEFTRAPGPALSTVTVRTANGTALALETAAASVPTRPYEWRAVYAAGVDPVGWVWGDEVSNDTARVPFKASLGPGSRVAGNLLPAGASAWRSFDYAYRLGLPEA